MYPRPEEEICSSSLREEAHAVGNRYAWLSVGPRQWSQPEREKHTVSSTQATHLLGEDGRGARTQAWDQAWTQTPALHILELQALTCKGGSGAAVGYCRGCSSSSEPMPLGHTCPYETI